MKATFEQLADALNELAQCANFDTPTRRAAIARVEQIELTLSCDNPRMTFAQIRAKAEKLART